MTERNPLHAALLAATFCSAAAAAAEPHLAQRRDQLACANTLIIAQAACYGATAACVREALTFRRIEGSTTVAPHKVLVPHVLPDGKRVEALDYRVAQWSCVDGTNGGRYVVIVVTRAAGGDCSMCEYIRLYHPNGRLIASTLRFDADERPEENAKAAELIRKLIAKPPPGALRAVYGHR